MAHPKPAPRPPARAPAPSALEPIAAALELTAADDDGPAEAEAEAGGEAHEQRSATVEPARHGERLDRLLVALAPEFSRSHLQTLIARGHVAVDGQVAQTASRRLKAGQQVSLELVPTAESQAFRPEPMDLPVVHEDAHLLVLDKPAGWVVHPAAGHWSGTLLNGLLAHHAGAAQLPRAGIVHRLDKDTSGLMVVAKTLPAMTRLVQQIAAREVRRIYLALAHGAPAWSETRIEAPVGRDPGSRLRMAVVAGGKPARTEVQRLLTHGQGREAVAALRCRLHTGRTHQIRVHLASRGHALLADLLYGGRPALGLSRQALHAAELAFTHPVSGQACAFRAALPPDLAEAWRQVGAPTDALEAEPRNPPARPAPQA